jgi:hypothetical protein
MKILNGGAGNDVTAIHDNVAAEISAITEKGTPVDADLIIVEDSAASNVKKKVQLGNLSGSGGHQYVDRGDPASADLVLGSMTTDGTWRDWDVSSVVPAGAVAVNLAVVAHDADGAGSTVSIRKNGNSNSWAALNVDTPANNINGRGNGTVACDSNRVLEYMADNVTWTNIWITILGWWV